MIQVFSEYRGVTEYEEEAMGLMVQVVEERRQGARPPEPKPNWTRGPAPLSSFSSLSFLLLLLPSFPSPTWTRKEGGILLGVGWPPLGAPPPLGRPSPPPPLYIQRRGTPLDTTTIDPLDLLAMCGAPSTIIHLDTIVAVLRRSPASVEHHHRHHAVVLTELSSKLGWIRVRGTSSS